MGMGVATRKGRGGSADNAAAFAQLAERYRRKGDPERAADVCREGLAKFPDHLSGRVTLGWALLDLGDYDEARSELEAVLRRAPDNLTAIRGLAELHDRANNSMLLDMDVPGAWPGADASDAFQPAGGDEDDDAVDALVAQGIASELTVEVADDAAMALPLVEAAAAQEIQQREIEDVAAEAADHDLGAALAGLEAVADAAGVDPSDIVEPLLPEAGEAVAGPVALAAAAVDAVAAAAGTSDVVQPSATASANAATAAVEAAIPDFEAVDLEPLAEAMAEADSSGHVSPEVSVAEQVVELGEASADDLTDAVAAFADASADAGVLPAAVIAADADASASNAAVEEQERLALVSAAAVAEAHADAGDLAESIAAFAETHTVAEPMASGQAEPVEVHAATDRPDWSTGDAEAPLADLDSPLVHVEASAGFMAREFHDLDQAVEALSAADDSSSELDDHGLLALEAPHAGSDAHWAHIEDAASALATEDDSDLDVHGADVDAHRERAAAAFAAVQHAEPATDLADEMAAYSAMSMSEGGAAPDPSRDSPGGADLGTALAADTAEWTPPSVAAASAVPSGAEADATAAAFEMPAEFDDRVIARMSAAEPESRAEPVRPRPAMVARQTRLEAMLRRVQSRRLRIAAESVA